MPPQSQRAIEIKAERMNLLARTQGSRKDLYVILLISFTPSRIILLLSKQSIILVYSVIKPVFFSCFQAFQHSSKSKQTHFKTLPGSKTKTSFQNQRVYSFLVTRGGIKIKQQKNPQTRPKQHHTTERTTNNNKTNKYQTLMVSFKGISTSL